METHNINIKLKPEYMEMLRVIQLKNGIPNRTEMIRKLIRKEFQRLKGQEND